MKVGTRSILYGAHCWFIHPWFVALAWWKLYGFPFDFRLWLAFALHDIGYWGKPNMDGPEGETHPEVGASIMHRLFDRTVYELHHHESGCVMEVPYRQAGMVAAATGSELKECRLTDWHDFTLLHSRYYAKKRGQQFSRLCVADKLAVTLEPWWLYLPRVVATGEIREYLANAESMHGGKLGRREWFDFMCDYLRRWVNEHRDGREDTWTPKESQAA